jgi:hypothetical protein
VKHGEVGEQPRSAQQLANTSTPLPFECFYAARVPDCEKLERTLHLVFGETRARQNREFFRTNPDLAKAIIEPVALEEEIIPDRDQSISPAQRREIDSAERSGSISKSSVSATVRRWSSAKTSP